MSDTAPPIATCTLQIDRLLPTQMSVGIIEVGLKRAVIAGIRHDADKLHAFQLANAIPGVHGPGMRFYIIDHHHMARALYDEGITHTRCNVMQDLSHLDDAMFWERMTALHWVYPYDSTGGGPHAFALMPSTVEALQDDVYRSLAGAVEKAGGFQKTSAPFVEFVWADRLRGMIPLSMVQGDFQLAVTSALRMIARPTDRVR